MNVVFWPSTIFLKSLFRFFISRTVKFWDLDSFGQISSTEVEASRIRSICFDQNGNVLFSAGSNSLHAYHWEPCTVLDSVVVPWSSVSDLYATDDGQLVSHAMYVCLYASPCELIAPPLSPFFSWGRVSWATWFRYTLSMLNQL
jgi:hypothetical protein